MKWQSSYSSLKTNADKNHQVSLTLLAVEGTKEWILPVNLLDTGFTALGM